MTTLQQQAAELAATKPASFEGAHVTSPWSDKAAALLRQFAELGKGEGLTPEQIDQITVSELGLDADEFQATNFARAIESAVRAQCAGEIAELRKGAERYRWLRQQHEGREAGDLDAEGIPLPSEPTAVAFTVFRPGRDFCLEPVGCWPGELDEAIDMGIAQQAAQEGE